MEEIEDLLSDLAVSAVGIEVLANSTILVKWATNLLGSPALVEISSCSSAHLIWASQVWQCQGGGCTSIEVQMSPGTKQAHR